MLDQKYIDNLEQLIKKGKRVTKKDLLALPPIADNPISNYLIQLYTKETTEEFTKKSIDFHRMITDLNNFVSGTNLDFKLKFLFDLYDTDRDEHISNHELFCMLEKLCDNSIDGIKIQNIVDQTFRLANSEKLSYAQFVELIKSRTKNIETFFFVNKKN